MAGMYVITVVDSMGTKTIGHVRILSRDHNNLNKDHYTIDRYPDRDRSDNDSDYHTAGRDHNSDGAYNDRDRDGTADHRDQYSDRDQHRDADDVCNSGLGIRTDGRSPAGGAGDRLRR